MSSSSSSRAFALANRLIGRYVFRDDEMKLATTVKDTSLPASIHFYYDDLTRCIYLLGVARPDHLNFSPPATIKDPGPSSESRDMMNRRQEMTKDESENRTLLERIRNELDTFERERLKMQVLLYACCHILIVLREDARVTTNLLRDVRLLAAEKAQLLRSVLSSNKHSKRESGHLKGFTSSSSRGKNAFAPGRCVPLVVYVVPAPEEILHSSIKAQSSGPTRSAIISFCKAIEERLTILFQPLRGSSIGSLRMRDALNAVNHSKERRVFNLDPAHSVVVVSRRTATSNGRAVAQLEELSDALESDTIDDDIFNTSSMLQLPADDDDMGFQRLSQYVQKYLDLLFSFVPTNGKDGGRTELMSPSQWVKTFHGLVKGYHRIDSKRKQESVASGSGDGTDFLVGVSQTKHQLDTIERTL
ncbi:hypothetical protein PsorP6_008553 [Peronosclerospora sorghi]|uniref:Uncharacterized protein n=1 Tax=Peronosclerospora sorghi TaxID=230839 RepID=A0ACC0WAQ5_9STRA|nr:hypothetical protein PsorP6_008553 [Peronosclerospora sorghi]